VPVDGVTSDLVNTPVSPGLGQEHAGGFEWSEQAYIFGRNIALSSSAPGARNGFYNGVTSGNQAIYNNASAPFFVSRDGSWTLESASFTGAWHEDLVVTVTDQSPGVGGQPRQVQFELGAPTAAQAVQIGLDDVTRVKFSVSGGIEFGFPGTPSAPPAARMVVIDDMVWSRLETVNAVVYVADDVVAQQGAITTASNLLWQAPTSPGAGAGGMYGAIVTMDQRLDDLRTLASAAHWQERAGEAVEAAKGTFADALENALLAADAASRTEDRVTQDHAEAVRIHAVSSLLAEDIGSQDSIVTAFEKLVATGAPLEGFDFSGDSVRAYHDRIATALTGIEDALVAATATRVSGGNLVIGALQGTVFTAPRTGGTPIQSAATVEARLAVFDGMRSSIDAALAQQGNGVSSAVIDQAAHELRAGLERFQSDAELATSRFAAYSRSAEEQAADRLPQVAETALIESAVERPIAALQALRQADADAAESARRVGLLLGGSSGRATELLARVEGLRSDIEGIRTVTGDRFGDIQALKDGLDDVHATLLGLLAPSGTDVSDFAPSVASLRADFSATDVAGRISGMDQVAGDAATVAPLVEVRRADVESQSAAAVAAVTTAAGAARHAADAAARLADAARDFQSRFEDLGFDASDVERDSAVAAVAADEAERHRGAAEAAHASMRDGLFANMPSSAQGGWAAWVQSLNDRSRAALGGVLASLQSNGTDAAAVRDQLAAYSMVNALGARAVGETGALASTELQGVIDTVANDGKPWSGGELDAAARLRVFEAKVSAADSALLSADASVLRANQAADSAVLLSAVAVARRDDAERGVQAQDSVFTVASARLSRTAADLTAVRTNEAHAEVGVTTALVNGSAVTEVNSLGRDGVMAQIDSLAGKMVDADGSINGDRSVRRGPDAGNDARPEYAADSIRGQIEFYNDVVNVLSGRVDPSLVLAGAQVGGQPVTHGDLARGAVDQMDAVRSLAQNAARELARQADQAMQMAERGRSNADRFFGKSLHTYVSNAQAAHTRAFNAWQVADGAAREAKGFADTFGTGHGIAADGIRPVEPEQPEGQPTSGPSS
jgi:hypothetical protein